MRRFRLQIVLAVAALLATVAFGQNPSTKTTKPATSSKTAGQPPARGESPSTHAAFSSRDRETIRVYFKNLLSKHPHDAGGMPANFQSDLAKGSLVVPSLQKRFHPLPKDLEEKLPHLADYYVRGSIDTDVILMDRRTNRVEDIIKDALRP
jgi:hypothetical protein